MQDSSQYALEAPHFHCDRCLEISPVYLGCYRISETEGPYCHPCFMIVMGWSENPDEGEEWKDGIHP